MPKHSRKRKHRDEDSEKYIRKKIRKLEKKLKRHKHSSCSSDCVSDDSRYSSSREVIITHDETDSELMSHYDPVLANEEQSTHLENSVQVNCTQTLTTEATPLESALTSAQHPFSETQHVRNASQALVRTASNENSSEPAIPELDKDILELLGETPSKEEKYGSDIKNELAVRWNHILTTGLTKETRKELIEKYLTPANCKNIKAPILNPETKAALSDNLVKKDKAIENKQKQRATVLSCLGEALTRLFDIGFKDPSVIRPLLDSARLTCDLQHTDSLIRRSFICSTLKKEVKDQLYATEIDKYLFSEKLSDTLKAAKAIYKSGTEMKVPTSKPKKPTTSNRPLNSKPPLLNSRSAGVSRKQEPAAETSRRYQPTHSSTAHVPYKPRPRSQAPNQRRR